MYAEKPGLHLRQRQHRPGTLRTLAVDVTSLCNMQCGKCYAEPFNHTVPFDLDAFRRTADEAYGMGVYHYVLQGGEPIADPDRLEAIIGLIHPEETYVNVVSNGWKMDLDRIRWLKRLQVDKICFSMDSGIAAEHDGDRGPGSFQRVVAAVDQVLAEGLLTSLSVVVTHESLHSEGFQLAYRFAEERRIRIDVQIAEPVGKWETRLDLLLTPEDSATIKRLQRDSPILANGQRMVSRDIYSGETDHCPAGGSFMAIASDGSVLPCNFLQQSLGNIQDKSLAGMRRDLLQNPWFDGAHGSCLCGEDTAFMDRFILPYQGLPKPLDAYAVYGLKDSHGQL
jgi:MoaA/NifB/PqqE/SkfB family radical SAM enzyme